jgi:SAM-dependent methyltransferase
MPEPSTDQTRRLKATLEATPILGRVVRALARTAPVEALRRRLGFRGSSSYWEQRYRQGGTSGSGSYGQLASFKAEILNDFVAREGITSIVEFGCGDGAQLTLAQYPAYVGIDVAPTSIALCRARFADDPTKQFHLSSELPSTFGSYDLALSLDVIYHLVEDSVFDAYMDRLFAHSRRFVAVYASNSERTTASPHVRHRNFTRWVEQHAPQWRLWSHVPNRHPFDPAQPDETSFADFYFFRRDGASDTNPR